LIRFVSSLSFLGYLIAIVFIYSGFIGMWIVEFIHVRTAYHLFVKMPRTLFERGDLEKRKGREGFPCSKCSVFEF
jgi:hypothetical protein